MKLMNTPDNLENISNMICDWCKRVFPADARAVVETTIYIEDNGKDVTEDDIASLKANLCLTEDEALELMIDGEVSGVAAIVCLQCQDEDI